MYPYQKDNSIIIIVILLLFCCCCSGAIYCSSCLLYAYYYYSDPDGYTKFEGACVSGNIFWTYQGIDTVRKCAKLCDNFDQCLAFEVYADHEGENTDNNRSGMCQLNTSADRSDCDGRDNNLNLYIRDSPPSSDPTTTAATTTTPVMCSNNTNQNDYTCPSGSVLKSDSDNIEGNTDEECCTSWFVGDAGQSCNAVCLENDLTCEPGEWGVTDQSSLVTALEESNSGIICNPTGMRGSGDGVAPWMRQTGVITNPNFMNSCNWNSRSDSESSCGRESDNYIRLCKCSVSGTR